MNQLKTQAMNLLMTNQTIPASKKLNLIHIIQQAGSIFEVQEIIEKLQD